MAQLSAAITGGAATRIVAMPSPPPHSEQQKSAKMMQIMPSKMTKMPSKMASLPVPMGTTIVSNVARDSSAGQVAAHCKFIGDKRVEGGCKRRRQRHSWTTSKAALLSPMSIAVVLLVLIAYCCCVMQAVEGYNIDRLYNSGTLSEAQQQAIIRQFQSADELWRSTNKKSPEYNGKLQLNKFAGNGGRNCFFTPIQCMLKQDMNKLRRMVDPADIAQLAAT